MSQKPLPPQDHYFDHNPDPYNLRRFETVTPPEVSQTPKGLNGREKLGALGLAALAAASGFVGYKTLQDDGAVIRETTTAYQLESLSADMEEANRLIAEYYQASEVVEQGTPFGPISAPGREKVTAEEQKIIDGLLEKHQAEFITAVQLSSGLKINIYKSGLDDKQEPLEVDIRALDIMVNEVIKQAGEVENSPVQKQMELLQKQAAKGKVNLKIDMMLVSDESLCLENPANRNEDLLSSQTLVEKALTRDITRCGGGVNSRVQMTDQGAYSLNQFIMALDMGVGMPRGYYSPEVVEKGQSLAPGQKTAVTISHELGHAFVGITDQNAVLGSEREHNEFVYPLESQMYAYYCDLGAIRDSNVELITPVQIEAPTSNKSVTGK